MKTKGFSLLEVLIAIVVITVGIAALIWAFASGMFAATDVESVDLALNIAQAKMEDVFDELKNADFSDLNEAQFEIQKSGADPDFPDFDVDVELDQNTNPMQVDVTVTWNTKGGPTSIVLTTLVADF